MFKGPYVFLGLPFRSGASTIIATGTESGKTESFHVIVMPEHRSQGCPPAEDFIDQLMNYQGNSNYYVCLLSAAEEYGAGHQPPQQFQVMIEKNRRDIPCGSFLIKCIACGTLANVPVSLVNSPWGTVRFATPEVTALELLGYPGHSRGLNNAVTVILDLVDYDRARKAIQEVIDMPDQKLDLFIRLCLQNNGRLSAGKRKTYFAFLKNDELEAIEMIVQKELSGKQSSVSHSEIC